MAKKTFKDPFASIRATQEKELKKLQEQVRQPKANPPMDFTGNIYQKKGVSTVLPETVAPSPWKRLPSAGGIGLLKGTMNLADKINPLNYAPTGGQVDVEGFKKKGISLNEPTLQPNKPAGVYSKQVNTLPYTDTTLEGLKGKAGLQGTLAEEIFYGIGHETPAIVASYGTIGTATKIPAIGKALTGAGKWTETGRRGVAAGALYTPIAEENAKLKDYLENMALFGVGDVAFTGAAHGISKGIKTLKGKPAKPPATEERSGSLDYLLGEGSTPETRPDYAPKEPATTGIPKAKEPWEMTNSEYHYFIEDGGKYVSHIQIVEQALAEGKPVPAKVLKDYPDLAAKYSKYAPWVREDLIGDFNQQRATELPGILTREQDPWAGMRNTEYSQPWPDYIPPQGVVPDFTGAPYGVYRGIPRAELPGAPEPLALPGPQGTIALTTHEMKALPPWQRTPKPPPKNVTPEGEVFYVGPQGETSINTNYLKELSTKYNDLIDTEVSSMKNELGGVASYRPDEYGPLMRATQNPAWYRNFWQKHLRAPREGEWRDLAIKNLMEGNPETGEPANADFLAIMSELSRGQRLPEEWHGIQRTIRDLEGSKGEYVPEESTGELDSLLADMRTEQGKVEPYGLTRDMGRLSEAENAYRGRMEDKADFGQYAGVKFKTAPMEAVIGKGNSGEVIRKGDYVYKNATNEEAAIYNALSDVEGIAKGALEGDKVKIPYYEDIISIDTIPRDKRNMVAPIILKNIERINKAVAEMSNRNIRYSDQMQFGVNKDGTMDLMDFSIARIHEGSDISPAYPRNVAEENYNLLEAFYRTFGLEKQAEMQTFSRNVKGWLDSPLIDDIISGEFPIEDSAVNAAMQIVKRYGKVKPENVYYATNAREVQLGGVYQTEPQNGFKIILADKPLTAKQKADWEISTIYEQSNSQPKFKYADSTAKKAVGEANQTLGLTRGDKDRITYAADGWTPEMELADKAANALSGTGVIPVKMPSFMDKFQGFFEATNRKIFVNKNTKDPVTYVAYHETGHRMKETHPEHYARIEEIALNNLKEEHSGLIERYSKRGYGTDEMPEEFTSDLIAEMLHDKTFIGKLREQAPEVIKPLLDILDEVITKVKLALGKDDSVLPYIENLEKLRNELSPEYASYLETVQAERMAAAKYREGWGKAAKVGGVGDGIHGLSNRELEGAGYIPVYRGVNADGLNMRASDDGVLGGGIYFYSSPKDAAAYAGRGGGIITGYIHPNNAKITKSPYSSDVIVVNSPGDFIGRGVIPTEQTLNLQELDGLAQKALTNPNIRFKVGTHNKSPVDDLKAMVEYGAGQLHKGNYSHFIKLMEKQFPDELSGYNPEITERLMKDVYLRAKELRDTGQTQLEFPGQVVTVRRGEQGRTLKPREKEAPATEPTASTQRIAEIDKELEALGWRIKGTEKSTTKYPTDEARSVHISELQARANELTQERNLLTSEGQQTYNDISGFQAETQDVARNFRDFYGRDVELEEGSILDEMNTAKSSNIDYQEYWVNKLKTEVVDRLGIDKNSPLSKLVQQYGEGEITLEQLKLMRPKDWQKVVEADGWFREAYDTVLDDVNRVIEQIYPGQPDRLVPKRKDYYRHFRDLEGFQGLQGMMGSPANISPELAGRSEFVKPKTKWASFKQQRGLGEFKRDAVGGFLEYLPAASYSINIDPMIGRFRGLSDQLAAETSGEANTMIRYLQDYANNLAGKTSGWDRKLQEVLELKGGNRVIMNTIMWLNNRAKQNAILLNPGSALSQLLNMPNVLGMGKQHVVPGIGKALLSIFKEDTARASSAFMKERFSGAMYRQFDTRMIDQPKRFAVWLIEVSDRLGTEMIWQTCHSKGLHTKGVANPVKYADAMTKRLVAGRGIGEMALIQQSKIFNVIAPFQVEVGNLWKVQKDLMKEKDFAGLVLLYAGLWLANSAMEEVRGMRVAFDPIDALINAGKEIADPKNEPKEKAVKAVGRLAGEVLGNIPVGQTIAAAYPEYGIKEWGLPTRKEFFGRDDPTRFGTGPLVVKAVQDPAKYLVTPFGGAQIDKTWKAAKALYNEGSYKNDDETGIDRYIPNITASGNMRYPVEVNAENTVKGLLFGPSAMDETKEFYENDRRPLGEKDTRRVEQAANPQAKYQDIMRKKKIDSIREKIRDVRKDKKLTPEQKRRKVNVLESELRKVRQAQ